MKQINISIMAGDGIGPEVMESAIKVLDSISNIYSFKINYTHLLVGGASFDKYKSHLTQETLQKASKTDAILFGSVGGPVSDQQNPKWKNCEKNSILSLRKHFNFNTNLRPIKVYPELIDICPLKESIVKKGIDILIIRELSEDIYFGEHKTIQVSGKKIAYDQAFYTEECIRKIAHTAFKTALKRNKKLTSVDKANVLDTSVLWREIFNEVKEEYPEVEYQDMLVDNCAMQLITKPFNFDCIVTSNMFGDILSDLASVFPGSLGLCPSISFSDNNFNMYEPSGGSAQDIVGKGIANPIAQILSAALMLKYSFNLDKEAKSIFTAIEKVISSDSRTIDISSTGTYLSTKEITDKIIDNLI